MFGYVFDVASDVKCYARRVQQTHKKAEHEGFKLNLAYWLMILTVLQEMD